jgi:hypothetical protein
MDPKKLSPKVIPLPARVTICVVVMAVLGGICVAVASMSVPTESVLVFIVAITGICVLALVIVPMCARRPALWVAGLLLILALVPNSSTNIDERILGEGARLFTR